MTVSKLRRVLADLGSILTAAGSTKPTEDVARLAELMVGREQQPVEEFLEELRRDIAPLSSGEIVAVHIARLRDAGTDEVSFRHALQMLASDRAVKKAQADRVAHGYIGGREKWPTRTAAVKAIEKEFELRLYDTSKMKEVARSRPW
jgi:hypothetical protein